MRNSVLFCFILLCMCYFSIAQLQPIGQWREHLSYNQAISVTAANNTIFCATPYAIFSVAIADNTIERFSKIKGLHEVGVKTIQWNDHTQNLIVAYNNSNIDILKGNKIYNIDAIKQKETVADKKINRIFCDGDNTYLCSGLGIIVINENKYEIKDTYIIGNTGNVVNVNGLAKDENFFYAATNEGIKKAAIHSFNLSDYKNWLLLNNTNGLSAGACENIFTIRNKLIAQKNDSLFYLTENNWQLLYANNWQIDNVTVSENRLLISQKKDNIAKIIVLDSNGLVEKTIEQKALIANPQQAIIMDNSIWIADAQTGLVEFDGVNTKSYQPNSPLSISNGEMIVNENVLWVASGGVTGNWTNMFTKNGLYQFANSEWNNFNSGNIPALDSLYDITNLVVNQKDKSVWAGSFGGGLFQLQQNKNIQVYKQTSPLSVAINSPSQYFIAGLAFDSDNNLWIANYGASQNLAVKKANGSWQQWFVPLSLNNNAVSQILVDAYNQKWIVSPGGNGLICFNHGQSIDNFSDDKWKLYKTGKGLGNLPNNNILCIAQDKNDFIWVGTTKGIGIIQCPQQVFTPQGCDAILPIVQQDNFAGYLFGNEQIQCIAIDGANRKWIGTKNGVWLISADGDRIIYRFTDDNSALLNNDVQKMAIDNKTGEIFFATAQGICSFRSTATTAGIDNSEVLVFPNPVPPGYNGTIAIRGLPNEAIVKITALNGRLVYQTRALGGQAVWNGKNYKGETIATAVYLVLVSNDSKQEKLATKIVFISK